MKDRIAYRVGEVAEMCGLCERTVNKAIKEGRLNVKRIGRAVLITRSELLRFVGEKENEVSK